MIRVAIVEDSKTIRESLTHFVQTDPSASACSPVRRPEEALAGILKHQPEVVSHGHPVARAVRHRLHGAAQKRCSRRSKSSW